MGGNPLENAIQIKWPRTFTRLAKHQSESEVVRMGSTKWSLIKNKMKNQICVLTNKLPQAHDQSSIDLKSGFNSSSTPLDRLISQKTNQHLFK